MVYPAYGLIITIAVAVYLWWPNQRSKLLPALVAITGFSVYVALRGAYAGSDTINYVNAFIQLQTVTFDYLSITTTFISNGVTAAEPGFILLAYAVKWLQLPYEFFLGITAFVSLVALYIGYRKLSPDAFLATILYLFSITAVSLQANVIRQAIAVGMFIVAVAYLTERKHFKFLFFSVSAGLFHISAFALVPLLVISIFIRRHIIFWLGVVFALGLALTGLFGSFLSLFIGGVFLTKIQTYFQFGFEALLTFKLLSFFIFYAFLLFLREQAETDDERYQLNTLSLVYIACFFLQAFFMGDEVASERFGLYRFALEPVIISFLPIVTRQPDLTRAAVIFLAMVYGFIVYNLPTVVNMLGGYS
ncbi:EpsG family protein [Idiomarina seosinensis]|uniref:EpsG family protein n=1 Tax=Idiomarina seosinensis TaxID=281739 RepID=UPI0038505E19